MPYFFFIAGVFLIVSGIQNSYRALFAQLRRDLLGRGDNGKPEGVGFGWWIIIIAALGGLGYIGTQSENEALSKFSKYFLILFFIAIILGDYRRRQKTGKKGSFFDDLNEQLKSALNTQTPEYSNTQADQITEESTSPTVPDFGMGGGGGILVSPDGKMQGYPMWDGTYTWEKIPDDFVILDDFKPK